MTLQEQLAQAKAEARKSLEANDLAKGKEWREKAEGFASAMAELKALDGIGVSSEPMRPPLPGLGGGTTPPANDAASNAVKAIYVTRFGDDNDAIKSLLIDLNGPDYALKYWNQKRAFNQYLRMNPQLPIPQWVNDAMREVVYTPEVVKSALMQGADLTAMKTVMIEAADVLGGYIVPVDFQTRVISRLMGFTQVRKRADVGQTSRDRVEFPVLTGGTSQYPNNIRVTWVNEVPTAGTAATNYTWGQEAIPIYTVMAEASISRNTVEDAAVDLEGRLSTDFADASAIDEDNRFLTGTGIGSPQGILPGNTNALGLTEALTGAAYDSTKSGLGFLWDGMVAATWKLDAQYRQNAAFVANKTTYGALATLKDSVGNYLWREAYGNNVSLGGGGTAKGLLGFPVLEQEGMPNPGTNAYPMIFGDFSGYWIRDRIGMSVERYLDSATARVNQVIYVMRRRLGGQVTQPWKFIAVKQSA